jgi:hypothetical protein
MTVLLDPCYPDEILISSLAPSLSMSSYQWKYLMGKRCRYYSGYWDRLSYIGSLGKGMTCTRIQCDAGEKKSGPYDSRRVI